MQVNTRREQDGTEYAVVEAGSRVVVVIVVLFGLEEVRLLLKGDEITCLDRPGL